MKFTLAILVALGAVALAMAEKQPFERYQTIIDRMPFGQPPPGFDPTKDPSEVSKDDYSQQEIELTQEQEAIQKAIRFSVINVENDGTVRVGFSDLTDSKAPRHFYLAVGETRGGWSVTSADPSEKKMTVEKDGVSVDLTLGENSSGIDSKAIANARNAAKPPRSQLLGRGGATAAGGADAATPMTLRGRRERREAEEAAKRAADAKQAAELAAEREREREEREKREEEERAAREAERAEQREQLNALKAELMRQREEAKAARERGGDSDEDDDDESSDE